MSQSTQSPSPFAFSGHHDNSSLPARLGLPDAKYQFVRMAWCAACESMADKANAGCGLVYELYTERFTLYVNRRLSNLPVGFHDQAIEIAREYGYFTREEALAEEDPIEAGRYCVHHLPFENCPVGCGDRDDICTHHMQIDSCSLCSGREAEVPSFDPD